MKPCSDWPYLIRNDLSFLFFLKRGNYCGLEADKSTESRSWNSWRGLWMASSDSWCWIDDSQFRFVPGRGTTDAVFVVRAAREVSRCQQETLHGLRRPGEGIWSSASEGHLVGTEKTWCGGVDCATGAGNVCQWGTIYFIKKTCFGLPNRWTQIINIYFRMPKYLFFFFLFVNRKNVCFLCLFFSAFETFLFLYKSGCFNFFAI